MDTYLVYCKYYTVLNFDLNNDYECYIHEDLPRSQFNVFDCFTLYYLRNYKDKICIS